VVRQAHHKRDAWPFVLSPSKQAPFAAPRLWTSVPDDARLYIFYGPDGFSAREALRALRERLDTDGNLAHNTSRFDAGGDPLKVDEVIGACQTASFFAETRLVIVEGILAKLGGGRRVGGRGRGRGPSGGDASEADRLINTLTSLPDSTIAVLLEENPPKAILDALAAAATLREFKVLRGNELRSWAHRRAQAQGARLTPNAVARLTELIDGHHLGDLAQEIDKLSAYVGDRAIDVDDVDALVSVALQYQTWDLTDAVIAGRPDRALQVLQRMDEKQHPAQLLFAMLVRQYRQVLLVQALKREGVADTEVARRLGVGHPFPYGKLADQAQRYQPARLEQAYRRLFETDVAVKTGVLDIETALEMLIVELASFTGSGQRSAVGSQSAISMSAVQDVIGFRKLPPRAKPQP